MADRHLNIFHAYRHGDFGDPKDEPILEDNLTRALLITVRSCDSLTQEFIRAFTGIDTQGPYEHDLQSRLGPSGESEARSRRYRDKCLIAVARRPEEPESSENGESENAGGSRPDAWITSENAVLLFENKNHGSLDDAQIRRHIRVNLGPEFEPVYPSQQAQSTAKRNQVPVALLSWNYAYSWMRRFLDQRPSLDGSVRFIISQFLDYLEVNGMGEVKFDRSDLQTPDSELGTVHSRIESLGDELAKDLGSHWLERQKRDGRYLGINLMHDDFKGEPSYRVPHWSLGWVNGSLALFISCEGKNVAAKLVSQRAWLEPRLTEALWDAQPLASHGVTLEVTEKLNFLSGGKGINAPLRRPFASFPLGLYQTQERVGEVVRQTFDSMDYLLNSEATRHKVEVAKEIHKNRRASSITGVLDLKCYWNWLELENEGTAITARVMEVARQLMPCYQSIVDAYQRRSPRRGRQAESVA